MLPKNQLKLITSLAQKKYRREHGLFMAEGFKTVTELLDSHYQLHHLYFTNPEYQQLCNNHTLVSEADLKKMSALKTANDILGVFTIPKPTGIDTSGLVLALDDVRDPGNLGTIIRLCDWFGIKDLVCSLSTVDCYNPKVVQASMGSLGRVQVSYVNMADFLNGNPTKEVFGTFMDGKNVYERSLPDSGILVMGNEANGIRDEIAALTSERLAIPRFGKLKLTESLNVATATAILLSEFRRSTTGT